MTRQHGISLVRRLRPSPERLAAAAAAYDPGPMLQLQAARSRGERTDAHRRGADAPGVRRALTGETGSAWLLVAAIAFALVWSNSPWHATYAAFWHAPVGLTIGPWTLAADLRTWIDEGLMTLFFLVVGLGAKRERDLGELRERRRLTIPVLAGLSGAVISFVYPDRVRLGAAIVAAALLALLLALRAIAVRQFRRRGDSTLRSRAPALAHLRRGPVPARARTAVATASACAAR